MGKSEVWFELGKHSGEDVFLYVPKVIDDAHRVINNVEADRPVSVERYKRREFGFEITPSFPGDNGTRDLLLIFLAADGVESHALDGHLITSVPERGGDSRRADNRRGAMLVPVPEVVQAIEQFYVVPSVVRLYGRYPVADRIGEFAYLREVVASELGLGRVEFESKVLVRLVASPNAPD